MQLATSPIAIKAYLSTVLFLTTSFVLLTISTTAFLFFYYQYIPQINLSHVIYLQYGSGPYPYALTPLDSPALVSQQPYDISVHLHLPHTPNNLGAGNFMLDLSLLTDTKDPVLSAFTNIFPNTTTPTHTVLASSRRPAILPFSSPILGLTSTFVNLPWHLLSFRDLDSTVLQIPMFERLSFARGSGSLAQNIPNAIRLELQSNHILQVYSAKIEFTARFEGLRYIVYNYRVITYFAFSTAFYFVTILSMTLAWMLFSSFLSGRGVTSDLVKREPKRIKLEADHEPDRQTNGSTLKPQTKPDPSSSFTMFPSTAEPDAGTESTSGSDDSDQDVSLSGFSDSALVKPYSRHTAPPMPPRRSSSHSQTRSSNAAVAGPSSGPRPRLTSTGNNEDFNVIRDPKIASPIQPIISSHRSSSSRGIILDGSLGTSCSPTEADLPYVPPMNQQTIAEDAERTPEETFVPTLHHQNRAEGPGEQQPRAGATESNNGTISHDRYRDFDSGIGTSMESENPAPAITLLQQAGVTRRRSGQHHNHVGTGGQDESEEDDHDVN